MRVLALAAALALLPVVGFAAPSTPAMPVVRLAQEVTVHGDEVQLSDIADVEGEGALADRLRAVRVAPAPPAGVTQPLGADTVRARIHVSGIDVTRIQLLGAARVQVTRAFQTVRGTDLIEAVKRDVRARLEAAESRGEGAALSPISRPEDVRVPTGDLKLETRIHEGAMSAPTLAATVTVRVNGRERHHAVLTFQIAKLVSVVVAARALDPRRTLQSDDFRSERRPVGEVPPDALSELNDTADLEVLRPVNPGEVLTPRVVKARIAVKRGELVTLLLEGDGFRITTQGQANEDARRGDAVRVVNLGSKREVVGTVEGGGVVRVPYRKLGADR